MPRFNFNSVAMLAVTLAAVPTAAINLDTTGADNAAPASPAYRDGAGVWRIVAPGQRSAVPARATNQLTGNNTIEISYRDLARDNDIGFDDPQQGQQRRDVLTQVLTEIDTLIEDGGTLAIEVQASEIDGGGALAFASTFFPTAPNGFHPGAAMTHLTTGSDPFPGVPDMLLTVDFGYNWNSSMNPPASDEVDLYSVLIHEIIHGLGLISLSDSDGASLVSGGTPGVFSTFDSFLHTGSGVRLWSGEGRFRGLSSDLVGLDAGVEFRGANATGEFGTPVPVHAPEPYAQGSSLAHWHYMPETNDSIMQPAFGYGASYRMPRAHEVGALIDLGYSIQSTGSNDGETFDFAVVDGSWLNPQTPGEGIFLDYGPSLDMLFAAWFTFTLTPGTLTEPGAGIGDADQRWLTTLLELDPATGTATGTLMSRRGGEFDAPPHAGEGNSPVGSITIDFSACDQAHVEYTIDTVNLSGSFDIEPLERNVNPEAFTCRS